MPIPKRQYFDYSNFSNRKCDLNPVSCVRNTTEKELVEEFLKSNSSCISSGHVAPDEYIESVLQGEAK